MPAKTVTGEIVQLIQKQYLYVMKITEKLLRDLLIPKTIGKKHGGYQSLTLFMVLELSRSRSIA